MHYLWRLAALTSGPVVLSGCALIVDLPEPASEQASGGVTGAGGTSPGSGGVASGGTAAGGGAGAGGSSMTTDAGGTGAGGGATSTGGQNGGCPIPCDCDRDGYISEAGSCNGDDCDDNDDRVHPEQIEYFGERSDNVAVGFDFNCDGMHTQDPSLARVIGCLLTLCDMGEGYIGSLPACGESGQWGQCVTPLATCQAMVLDPTRVMLCN